MCEENSEMKPSSSSFEVEDAIIPGYASVEQFTKDGFKTLMEAIKHSNALPSSRDWDFYTTSESFKKIINDESSNVLRLMNQLLRCNDVDSNIRNRVLDEKMELIIEANDVILEKVANNIDELNGINKSTIAPVVLQTVSAQLPVNGSWNKPNATTFSVNTTSQSREMNCIKLLTAKNIVRPQKFFKDKIDNRNKVPWCPRITEKPNSLKPLAIFLEECGERQEYSHPYEYELDRFNPTPEQLLEEKPKFPKPISNTPLIEIEKPEQLDALVETLRTCKEFAVDVEHHSYRSFMGITCLLQISTEDKDYLIDTLALRDKLFILNEVFTKNNIVKIFHGADSDIEWLQRDLSIYVVNMFDTHQAAKMLEYQGLSLAFLMKKFCNIVPNKQFQLADWRIRPLPQELKDYAREDTHYLIYIYKMLKKELLLKANKSDNLLRSVIERSTEICKKRYFKPLLLEDSHLEMYRRCKKMFDNRQMYALKEIFAWRNNLAREEDESLGYVLPNHMLLQISETLPREMQGILACCNPIPPLVRSHLLQLHQIILKAREQPLEKAIMKETSGPGVIKKVSKVDVENALHCPHDLSKNNEFRDDLPCLLQNQQLKAENKGISDVKLCIEKPSIYSVFEKDEERTSKNLHRLTYFSPYERYKMVKPFVLAEDKASEANNEDVKKEPEIPQVPEQTNERTDDERIASIKDHFIQLSKKFSEELQAQQRKEEEERQLKQQQEKQSLLEMGGSRKRKREDENDFQEQPASNNFNSPIPKASGFCGRRNKGRKRKFNEIDDNRGDYVIESGKNNKKVKQTNNRQQNWPNQQPQKAQKRAPRKKKKNQQGTVQPFMGVKSLQAQNQQPNPMKKKKKKAKNVNANFTPYDYASVDFRQFQGGAGSANTGVQIKHSFKPKNRNNKQKKGTKSSTFANPKPNRRGQPNRNY